MKLKYIIFVAIIVMILLVYFLTSRLLNKKNMNNQNFQNLVNKSITLEGQALNAKNEALLLSNGNYFYIKGLAEWPKALDRKQLYLSGKLVLNKTVIKLENSQEVVSDYAIEQGIILPDKSNLGYIKLLDSMNFFENQNNEAVKAIVAELGKIESLEDFFISSKPDISDSEIFFELAHKDTFRVEVYLNVVGNATGKNRKASYNFINKTVNILLTK